MADPDDHSVTRLFSPLRAADEQAARQLWDRYCERLVQQATRQFGNRHCRVAHEEDIAIGDFHNLLEGLLQGRYPELADREELWAGELQATQ